MRRFWRNKKPVRKDRLKNVPHIGEFSKQYKRIDVAFQLKTLISMAQVMSRRS
jgi:hypothetical protein